MNPQVVLGKMYQHSVKHLSQEAEGSPFTLWLDIIVGQLWVQIWFKKVLQNQIHINLLHTLEIF